MDVTHIGPTSGSAELTLGGLAALGPGTLCDEEPIHLSGAVQPHGFLVGVDPGTQEVRVASANAEEHLRQPSSDILGQHVRRIFGETVTAQVAPLFAAGPDTDIRVDPLAVELAGGRFEMVAQRSGPLVLLEFDRSLGDDTALTTYHQLLRRTLDPHVALTDIRSVCDATAEHIRGLTGFDRVLIYRFDEHAHGAVISASVSPTDGSSSLVGLHYPAADIPRQARSLLLQKRLRMIPDVAYTPVGLIAQADRASVTELDLTMSDLRSVSPVHLQYLHDMGVAATLSISLVCNDQLWGLILCHHLQPRYIPSPVRAVCETVAWSLSLQLEVLQNRDERERSALRDRSISEVVAALGEADALQAAAAAAGPALTGLVDADAVMVRLAGETAFTGPEIEGMPDPDAFVTAVSRLVHRTPGGAAIMWSTDCLPTADLNAGSIDGAPVAGVLVLSLGGHPDDLIVWVRREDVDVVTWAGATPSDHPSLQRPNASDQDRDSRRPRDFTPRREVGHGHSRPWNAEEVEAARTLAIALPKALLRRARRLLVEQAARSNRELAAARDAALAASEAKSTFLATMSHEIRTPLNAVIGLNDMLLEGGGLDDHQRGHLRTIRTSGENLLLLVNDILDWSKIESGAMTLEQRPFDLVRCVEQAIDVLAGQVGEKDVDLLVDVRPGFPEVVVGDATRLRQIVINLAGNAVKFTEHGHVLVTVTTGPAPQQDPAGADQEVVAVRIGVSDTGIGVSMADLDVLFRDFSQVDGSTTRLYGGSGLGLAISQRLAQAMSGAITVSSQPGVGSTFTVELLFARAATGDVPRKPDTSGALLGRRALVVDDNLVNLRIVEGQLRSWGMHADLVSSGAAALSALDAATYDVGVFDFDMPAMDGLALLAEVAARPLAASLPVIMLTSVSNRVTVTSSAHPPARYLIKPVYAATLRDELAAVLGHPGTAHSPNGSSAAAPSPPASIPPQPGLRILVVEDNKVNVTVARLMLTQLGYTADVAANGREAVAAAHSTPYDVILMDVRMPVMDGLEATRRLRDRPPPGPRPWIVALTANAMTEDREHCAAAGMDDYLSKPMRRQDLAEVLTRTPVR